jgi:outer membrane protein assembly factor BamD (BamD/ComL family)
VSLFGVTYLPTSAAPGPGVVPVAANMPAAGPPGADNGPQPIIAAPVRADGAKSDDDGGWDLSKLAPDHIWKDLLVATGNGPDENIARQAFQEGLKLMREKKFDEGAAKFHTAAGRWPDSTLEEEAMFLEGECQFFADRYGKACDAYINLLKKHVNTRYLDTVMARQFAIGRYWDEVDRKAHHWPITPNFTDKTRPWFDTSGNALGAYDQVRLHDPTGALADSAVMASANHHFRNYEWEEAAESYDLLRREYPKSQWQKDAHILGIQSELRVYQGPQYDVTPLKHAEEIADQTLKQFHGRLGAEEQQVAETRAHIIEQKAEREWIMARYWDKKSCYRAARMYYKILLEKYPQTGFADASRKRLEEIRSLPDEPPKRFAWLTDLMERK